MNKNFVISVIVLFVLSMVLGFVVHGLLLAPEYAKLVPGVFRAPQDSEQHFGFMIAAHVIMESPAPDTSFGAVLKEGNWSVTSPFFALEGE